MANLVLGTAQLGSVYGITNDSVQMNSDEAHKLLTTAQSMGIRTLDSAFAYGNAMERIAAFNHESTNKFEIVTKYSARQLSEAKNTFSANAINSIEQLEIDYLHGILIHDPENLDESIADSINQNFDWLQDNGKLLKRGVSAYSESDLIKYIDLCGYPKLIQIPANIIDKSVIDSNTVKLLRSQGCEIHVRSAFLQGLLLLSPNELPHKFTGLADAIKEIDQRAHTLEVSRMTLLLADLNSNELIDGIVVGAINATQLVEINDSFSLADSIKEFERIRTIVPDWICDPRTWAKIEGRRK